ncbi:MAG: putative transposase, partial [Micromonosporaceae bacterium]|nr:putative transposase [Micromonosporaceae bacterium]
MAAKGAGCAGLDTVADAMRASRRGATPSIRFTSGVIRVETDRQHVTLPRVGRIKTHESTRKLARRLEAGTARIMS